MVEPKDQYNIFKSIDNIGDTQYKNNKILLIWRGGKNQQLGQGPRINSTLILGECYGRYLYPQNYLQLTSVQPLEKYSKHTIKSTSGD